MNDKDYLKLAIGQAKESVKQGGFPAGAVVACPARPAAFA